MCLVAWSVTLYNWKKNVVSGQGARLPHSPGMNVKCKNSSFILGPRSSIPQGTGYLLSCWMEKSNADLPFLICDATWELECKLEEEGACLLCAGGSPILFQGCLILQNSLWSTFSTPGTVVHPGCIALNKTDKALELPSSRPNGLLADRLFFGSTLWMMTLHNHVILKCPWITKDDMIACSCGDMSILLHSNAFFFFWKIVRNTSIFSIHI